MSNHLCHVFSTFGLGGAEVRTAAIINAAGRAYRHTIISIKGDLSCRDKIASSAAVSYRPVRQHSHPLRYTTDVLKALQEIRPDLLLTYGWGAIHGILAVRLYGRVPLLHTEDGLLPEEIQHQKTRRLFARRLLFRTADLVICPSRTLVRMARQQWWLPTSKIRYIPNGVDVDHFAPGSGDATRRRLGIDPDAVVIGTVSRLRPEKNHERLIRAFAFAARSDSRAKLLIVGDGPRRSVLEGLIRDLQLGGQVLFTGAHADPADYLRAMDVFALSSDTEQMPVSVLEAMSVGLPVVGTAVGDVPNMVSAENMRHMHALTQDEAFAGSLSELMAHPDRRAAIGQANRERCEREYSLRVMTGTYMDLYRRAIDSYVAPRRAPAAG